MLNHYPRLIVATALILSRSAVLAVNESGTNSTGTLKMVGIAKVDITPNYPIRLTGYAARKTESDGVAQHLYARALAIGSDKEKPAVLITVDNCGVPGTIREDVASRLHQRVRLDPDRLAICSTHTHSGPQLLGFAPNIFGGPLAADEQSHVEQYTHELTEALEKAAIQALEARQPAHLIRGQTQAGFAANRRTKGGPTDHDLPALFVTDEKGKLRAVFLSYACHCTTLSAGFNQICGDWAGFAAEYLEAEHSGAVAMVALGCAGDANPEPRPGLDLAQQHGHEIANAVDQLFAKMESTTGLTPVEGKLVCKTKRIELPFAKVPTRAELEARAKETNFAGSQARMDLARLDRDEKLLKRLPYMVQTWTFGNNLAMVFLPGEAVVDYSLRLKREFDRSRFWVNAYANDVPCYIPSERILKEGGYEGGGAMVYYDRPSAFAPGLEERIVSAVHHLLRTPFLATEQVSKKAQLSAFFRKETCLRHVRLAPESL